MSIEGFENWEQIGFVASLNDSKVFIKVFSDEHLSKLQSGSYVVIANNANGHLAKIEFAGQSDNVVRILAGLEKNINLETRVFYNNTTFQTILTGDVSGDVSEVCKAEDTSS